MAVGGPHYTMSDATINMPFMHCTVGGTTYRDDSRAHDTSIKAAGLAETAFALRYEVGAKLLNFSRVHEDIVP